jgi:hypothetical protein
VGNKDLAVCALTDTREGRKRYRRWGTENDYGFSLPKDVRSKKEARVERASEIDLHQGAMAVRAFSMRTT